MLQGRKAIIGIILASVLLAGAFVPAASAEANRAGATAVISSPANGALFETGARISFDGSRSTGSAGHNTTNPIISWEWTFGDGGNASGSMVSHAYHRAGGFQVTLSVMDEANATGNASITIYIAPPAGPQNVPNQPAGPGNFNPVSAGSAILSLAGPSAVISSPSNNALFELGVVVFFDGSKSTGTVSPNGSYPLVSWEWTLGDGSNASTACANHSYARGGCYVATLTVKDSMGVSSLASVTIYLSPPARPQNLPGQPLGGNFNPASGGGFILSFAGAQAVISSPPNGALVETDRNIIFDGSKSTGSSVQNMTYAIVSWNWSFGDGTTGAGTTAVHAYSAAGSYTITLTVTDASGASAFGNIMVYISPPARPQNIPSQPAGGSNFNPAGGGMVSI